MQIVIDIHEKDYKSILNRGYVSSGAVCAIMNGIPLPKGHGRLIDADRLIEEDKICDMWTYSGYEPMVTIETIENMPTIIEADGENEK